MSAKGTGTRGDMQTQLVWDAALPLLQRKKGEDKLRAQLGAQEKQLVLLRAAWR